MPYSSALIPVATERLAFLQEQRQLLVKESELYLKDAEHLEGLLERNREETASYLLAEVTDEALAGLQDKLRYPSLLPAKAGFEKELAAAEAWRAELEAREEIEHYELYHRDLGDQLDEIKVAAASFREAIVLLTSHKSFHALQERGYFEDGYRPQFLNYFRDWRTVSRLMAELEALGLHADEDENQYYDNPAELKTYVRTLLSEGRPVVALEDELKAKRESLEALKAQHDEALAFPEKLFARMYQTLSKMVIDHLHGCPKPILIEIAAKDKHLVTFLNKEAGLRKQVQYLRELNVTRIQTLINDLNAQISKLNRKISKARYKNKWVDQSQIDKMKVYKADKWEKRHQRLTNSRNRITMFSKYKKGSFDDDFLWWAVITNNAPADDIYEVSNFYRQNPHWSPATYRAPWLDTQHQNERAAELARDTAAIALTQRMQPNTSADDWSLDAS